MGPLTVPSAIYPVSDHSLDLLASLRGVFRDAGERLLIAPSSYEKEIGQARNRLEGLLRGLADDQEGGFLSYPLRASRRLLDGESYSPTRIRALERHFLRWEAYLKGIRDSGSMSSPTLVSGLDGGNTIPSPTMSILTSRPPSSDDWREVIRGAGGYNANLPPELGFIDLTRIREVIDNGDKSRPIAGGVLDLPMDAVLKKMFSSEFKVEKNTGDSDDFWAHNVRLKPFMNEERKPCVEILFELDSISEHQLYLTMFRMGNQYKDNENKDNENRENKNVFQILLKGEFEWRDGGLYIPLRPTRFSVPTYPLEALFGTATLMIVPVGEERTVFALHLEDKMLSKHPKIHVEGFFQDF